MDLSASIYCFGRREQGQKLGFSLPSMQAGVDIYLFWASWCPYCKALMPHLQSIQVEYGADFRQMGNRQKSSRVGPYWAAEIRRAIDQILAEDKSN